MGVDPGVLGHASTPVNNVAHGADLLLNALGRALAPHGLNLIGATTPEAYDAGIPGPYALGRLLPGAKGVVVIGNGGGDLWAAFRDFCRKHPGHEATADPLDAFTRRVIEEVARPLVGPGARFLYPFRFPDDPVSFMRLAECAGLGRPSLTGVLVHPVFGPWMALRAAILVEQRVDAARPADGFDPCPGCTERSCIPACPAGAVGPAGWDVPRCAGHRGGDTDGCPARCEARFECVVGREHRYPADALAYHQTRARASLSAFVTASGRGTPARGPGRDPTPRA